MPDTGPSVLSPFVAAVLLAVVVSMVLVLLLLVMSMVLFLLLVLLSLLVGRGAAVVLVPVWEGLQGISLLLTCAFGGSMWL